MYEAVILVGGLGTRLQPLTKNFPKPLLPILNKPFLEYFLLNLQKEKISHCILCVGYEYKKFIHLIEQVKQNKNLKLKFTISLEKYPLGTGGAVKNAEKHISCENFFVLNGDLVFDFSLNNLFKFHQNKKAKITISLIQVEDITNYGLVKIYKSNKINSFIEKPSGKEPVNNLINAGVYVFNKKVLSLIPANKNYSLERGLFPDLIRDKDKIFGKEVKGYWLDIGTAKKFFKLYVDILQKKIKTMKPKLSFKKNIYLDKSAKIKGKIDNKGIIYLSRNVVVENGCIFEGVVFIGENCKIEKNSFLKDIIIFKNCILKRGAILQNIILGENCILNKDVILKENIVIGANSKINDGVILWK